MEFRIVNSKLSDVHLELLDAPAAGDAKPVKLGGAEIHNRNPKFYYSRYKIYPVVDI